MHKTYHMEQDAWLRMMTELNSKVSEKVENCVDGQGRLSHINIQLERDSIQKAMEFAEYLAKT